jgi:AbrB family looped-hinge helix DNA binding protein
MIKAGIVGLPKEGKSTLFNAVTRMRKAAAVAEKQRRMPEMKISNKGQIVITPAIRERQGLRPGDGLMVFELSNGDILLRRFKPPVKSLAWHLRRLRGLQWERNLSVLGKRAQSG